MLLGSQGASSDCPSLTPMALVVCGQVLGGLCQLPLLQTSTGCSVRTTQMTAQVPCQSQVSSGRHTVALSTRHSSLIVKS